MKQKHFSKCSIRTSDESENKLFSGLLPLSESKLAESTVMSNRGAVIAASTVGGAFGLAWDSLVETDSSSGQRKLNFGLSFEIWDFIQKHAGLTEVYTEPANTWGSAEVRH